jgi:hypothetical protein
MFRNALADHPNRAPSDRPTMYDFDDSNDTTSARHGGGGGGWVPQLRLVS